MVVQNSRNTFALTVEEPPATKKDDEEKKDMSKYNKVSKNRGTMLPKDIQRDKDWNFYYAVTELAKNQRNLFKIKMPDEDGNFTHLDVFSSETAMMAFKVTFENTIFYMSTASKGGNLF